MNDNSTNDELAKLKSELELLKEINRNLTHENLFLKNENSKLKSFTERSSKETSLSINRVTLQRPKSHVSTSLQSFEDRAESCSLVKEFPKHNKQALIPSTMLNIEEITILEDQNFIVSGKKYLSKDYFLFDEVFLFGLSEPSKYQCLN